MEFQFHTVFEIRRAEEEEEEEEELFVFNDTTEGVMNW
jgi:hypothetical protein